MTGSRGIAWRITAAFYGGSFDLSLREGAPTVSWQALPEVAVADAMRADGASDHDVRLLLTFTAPMDRARDAERLWRASAAMFASPLDRWVFAPERVVEASLVHLADTLRRFGVSQRHVPDTAAWRVIGETLASSGSSENVRRAVVDGVGDAPTLLDELGATTAAGTSLFPYLRGPKVAPMWVRMLANPGNAQITNIGAIPVAVDVQVRRVTDHLGLTATGSLDIDAARPLIQQAWSDDVESGGAVGPPGLENTAAALDPSLWFMGKWGCSYCERLLRPAPIASVCDECDLISSAPSRG